MVAMTMMMTIIVPRLGMGRLMRSLAALGAAFTKKARVEMLLVALPKKPLTVSVRRMML
jgi:hypothetical protein